MPWLLDHGDGSGGARVTMPALYFRVLPRAVYGHIAGQHQRLVARRTVRRRRDAEPNGPGGHELDRERQRRIDFVFALGKRDPLERLQLRLHVVERDPGVSMVPCP